MPMNPHVFPGWNGISNGKKRFKIYVANAEEYGKLQNAFAEYYRQTGLNAFWIDYTAVALWDDYTPVRPTVSPMYAYPAILYMNDGERCNFSMSGQEYYVKELKDTSVSVDEYCAMLKADEVNFKCALNDDIANLL